jgi:hypothetical protein
LDWCGHWFSVFLFGNAEELPINNEIRDFLYYFYGREVIGSAVYARVVIFGAFGASFADPFFHRWCEYLHQCHDATFFAIYYRVYSVLSVS